MNEKVLLVDDDPSLLAALKRNVRGKFKLETAVGGEAGLKTLAANGPFAVVVSDRQMPGMDGAQFLAMVRQRAPDTVRIMLTGNVDLEQAVQVVNEGNIFRFLIKPCPLETVWQVIEDAATQHRLITAERELLNKTLSGSIKLLTDILSMVDPTSFGRSEKLRALITELNERMPLADMWEIQLATMLLSVGYVTLPPETLVKTRADAPLANGEEKLVGSLPGITARLIANIPRLEGVAKIVRYHQKNFNGTGFPEDSVSGTALPLGSRVLKIFVDLLQLQAKGLSQSDALDQMTLRQGWYDPQLLTSIRACFGLIGRKPEAWLPISIGANDLATGMTLASDILAKNGNTILAAGHHINETVQERIQNFKVLYGLLEPIYIRVPQG
jgi:response regulator RpfG family c-di-GMP phosphodiesterase